MIQLCPRCQRANPKQAVFCHFDGCMLGQGAGAANGQLLQEFVFPSGRKCRTYDELVQGCYHEWEEARSLLSSGAFAGFLAAIGRGDLAKAAREAQAQPDPDIGLTDFVAALPATRGQGPKLGLNPRRLVIGPLRVGEKRQVQVRVLNEGRGLLQGKISVPEGVNYLRLADSDDGRACALKFGKEQILNLNVETAELSVGQNYSTKLVALTNGGVAEVPVRVDLVARPFARSPYAGAKEPRELAQKMKANPHPAVALLESQEVARWFTSNGWTYPIAGPHAPGLAAVQQFFEELGLARPPQITISDQSFRFELTQPETQTGQVTIRSAERKLVYARAESDSPWLRLAAPGVSGQGQAAIEFTIDSRAMDESRSHVGTLKVVANAGQTFPVRIQVELKRRGWFSPRSATPEPAPAPQAPPISWLPQQPAAPPPTARPAPVAASAPPGRSAVTTAPAAIPVREERGSGLPVAGYDPSPAGPLHGSPLRTLLVGAMIACLMRLLLVFPADLYARVWGGAGQQPAPGTLEAWLSIPAPEKFLPLFVLATWWIGGLVGAVMVWQRGGKVTDLVCGLLAGAFAGMIGSATAGCVLVLGDELPRALLRAMLGAQSLGAGVATPLWIVATALCWLGTGAFLGLLLGLAGGVGRRVLATLGAPLAWGLRLCGLGSTADFFVLRA